MCRTAGTSWQQSPQRRAELRERLSSGANCLLAGFLGEIRPYKTPEALAYLPHHDSLGREVEIVVAEAVDCYTYDAREIEASRGRILPKRLIRIRERLSDQCLPDIIGAADVVLLPYLEA
jgi:hypothetical protein